MHEAKGSWNGYFRSAAGNKEQFTLRQADNEADLEFLTRVSTFNADLQKKGWKPWSADEVGQAKAAPAERTEPISAGAEKSFPVESFSLAAGGEHPRWTIKGGNFKKFGVTCWPEVLVAAGVMEHLDPMKDNKPKGNWVAYYIERENEDGKQVPDKVVRVERKK